MLAVSQLQVAHDLFVIPHAGRYLAYAPSARAVALVTAASVNLLWALREGRVTALLPCDRPLIESLTRARLIGPKSSVSVPHAEPDEEREAPFRPTQTTLFLTHACNLRCVYCYARGGEAAGSMPLALARAAIDLVAQNARATGAGRFQVGFHGGGEPTQAARLLRQSIAHAQTRARELGVSAEFHLGTNGVMSARTARFVADHVAHVTLSLDGPPVVQNRLRPALGGGPSAAAVERTARLFDAVGVRYAIRATVVDLGLQPLEALVRYFAANCGAETIQLEPYFPVGRGRELGPGVDMSAFVDQFVQAQALGAALGRRVTFSGYRPLDLVDRFCGACGRNFCVTVEGAVSACFEVLHRADPLFEQFCVGHFDGSGGGFHFDEERRQRLLARTGPRLAACRGCFAVAHCAGDCPAKAARLGGDLDDPSHNPRCEAVRGLLERFLVQRLDGPAEEVTRAQA